MIEDGAVLARDHVVVGRGHAERLVPMIAALPGQGRADAILVDCGPGSFTGLRVGLSAARGIALASGKPAIGLTTLAAFAAPLIAEDDQTAVVAAIDARHDHVYLQVVTGHGEALLTPRVAPVEEALAASRLGAPLLVGNAADLLAERWPKDASPPVKVAAQAAPDIVWVAWLAAAVDPAVATPRPFYLRAPDAKPPADQLPRAAETQAT